MVSVHYYDTFYIPEHTGGQPGRQNQPHCNPALITLRSPIDNSSRLFSPVPDITPEQSSRESVADAAVVEPISMIYIWLAGAGLDWNFLVKTSPLLSSISGAAQARIYKECLQFVVKPIFSQAVLRVE